MLKLQDLWKLSDRFAAEHGGNPADLFAECGLRLQRPARRWKYFCTPRNSITIADLGVDGTHFGFLKLKNLSRELQPIVMTVPANNKHNYVIAQSLEEFIGLGYHVGWLSLDQIAFGPNKSKVEADFARRAKNSSPKLEIMLAYIRTGLKVRHAPLSFARLADLDKRFGKFVDDGDEKDQTKKEKTAQASFLNRAELTKVFQTFRDAVIEKETFRGSRRDHRLHRTMGTAYHRLRSSGEAGGVLLSKLLSDRSPKVRSWVATALLVDGDPMARDVLEEMKDDIGGREGST